MSYQNVSNILGSVQNGLVLIDSILKQSKVPYKKSLYKYYILIFLGLDTHYIGEYN